MTMEYEDLFWISRRKSVFLRRHCLPLTGKRNIFPFAWSISRMIDFVVLLYAVENSSEELLGNPVPNLANDK